MNRIFIDTNIFISAYFWPGNERNLVSIPQKNINYFTSQQVLEEIKKVLKEKFNVNINDIDDYISKILSKFIIAKPDFDSQVVVRDEKDTDILKSALSKHCIFLITGDKDLLTLKKVKNMRILTSTELIKELKIIFMPRIREQKGN